MTNVEVKVALAALGPVRARLAARDVPRSAELRQRDTYFCVPRGRLKLRETDGATAQLIQDARADLGAACASEYVIVPAAEPAALLEVLARALGVRAVVEKRREIRFVGNLKFHLDEVPGQGAFVEIEAFESPEARVEDTLRAQCEEWRVRLGIAPEDLVAYSYSDVVSTSPRRHP